MKRRQFLGAVLALGAARASAEADYPAVAPGRPLSFPRDHGSHPDYRTEWWYLTGWVTDTAGRDYGVQVTFFRHRPRIAESNPSAFAPRQLLFAHAAIADPALGRLRHDQRAARAGFGLATASEETTRVVIDNWSLDLADDIYHARVVARDFELDLRFTSQQPLLVNGESGYSRKGPLPVQASWYYSRPQLSVNGTIALGGTALAVRGVAWLDHEWSSEYIASGASGWDWTGVNFDDGAALMAFRMRDRAGGDAVGGRHVARPGWPRPDVRTGSRPIRRAAHVAVAAHRIRLSGVDDGERRRRRLRARAADGRSGARFAREHGHDLLGRRGARHRRRAFRAGLSGAHGLRHAAAVVSPVP